jgi:hypothetical protein
MLLLLEISLTEPTIGAIPSVVESAYATIPQSILYNYSITVKLDKK